MIATNEESFWSRACRPSPGTLNWWNGGSVRPWYVTSADQKLFYMSLCIPSFSFDGDSSFSKSFFLFEIALALGRQSDGLLGICHDRSYLAYDFSHSCRSHVLEICLGRCPLSTPDRLLHHASCWSSMWRRSASWLSLGHVHLFRNVHEVILAWRCSGITYAFIGCWENNCCWLGRIALLMPPLRPAVIFQSLVDSDASRMAMKLNTLHVIRIVGRSEPVNELFLETCQQLAE